jgi:hypothetical protein
VAIIVALCLAGILVVAAMVLDFGLIRIDRQVDRSAADAATLAGLHGLNTGDGTPHPYIGVCTAIRYLKVNTARFSGVNEATGWSDGLGGPKGNGCTDTTLRNTTCKPAKTSWAKWAWTGTSQGVTYNVTIESGYDFAGSQWKEDALGASTSDNGDTTYAGCDHLAVTISQSREPGFGSLATTSDLNTDIRSVGRIRAVPGDSAPAMLLLKRTGCPVLKTGASGGTSFVHVEGAVAPNGKTQPGTIHSDSDGVGCNGSNNSWIYGGLGGGGIVAYAAPLSLANPTAVDTSKPGSITSVASANGLTGTPVRDATTNVYGSSALNGALGTKTDVTGRSLVTRRLVDERFFPGVKPAMAGASTIFTSGASGAPAGFTNLVAADPCKPTQAEINAMGMTATSRLYVNCNGKFVGANTGNTFSAGTIYFRGWLNPAGSLKLVNAHHVYVGNHGTTPNADAISLGNGSELQTHTSGNTDLTGNCTIGQSSRKAVMFVRSGQFKQTGGLLRMCRTTVLMMGGANDGCVPATSGAAPTSTPCLATNNSGLGTGQFTQNGGGIDWTAPDTLDATTDGAGYPLPAAVTAWHDVNGMEDLALWTESGTNSSNTYGMAGGGLFQVRGVFMVPNAGPFIISGGASLNLTNAQYIATSIELNGNTTSITMRVDPNAAVTLPDQGLVGLVR